MIKNENGVTIVVLVITVIILFILTGASIQTLRQRNDYSKNDKWYTELGIVRQAVTEKYAMANAVNKNKVKVSEPQSEFYIGEKIEPNQIFEKARLTSYSPTDEMSHKCIDAFTDYSTKTLEYQEDYYYYLKKSDLEEIGISDSQSEYIVNYKTAEVFNASRKKVDKRNLLYLESTFIEHSDSTEDNESFNDWN